MILTVHRILQIFSSNLPVKALSSNQRRSRFVSRPSSVAIGPKEVENASIRGQFRRASRYLGSRSRPWPNFIVPILDQTKDRFGSKIRRFFRFLHGKRKRTCKALYVAVHRGRSCRIQTGVARMVRELPCPRRRNACEQQRRERSDRRERGSFVPLSRSEDRQPENATATECLEKRGRSGNDYA